MTATAKKVADTTQEMADAAIETTQLKAAEAEKTIQAGLYQLREAVPATVQRARHQVEDLARTGIDKARAASTSLRDGAHRAGEKTVDYVREEPVKAMLMAAAAGAAATLLIGWATRQRAQRH